MLQTTQFMKKSSFFVHSASFHVIVTTQKGEYRRKKLKPKTFFLSRLLKCKIIKRDDGVSAELPVMVKVMEGMSMCQLTKRQHNCGDIKQEGFSFRRSLTGNSIFSVQKFCCDDTNLRFLLHSEFPEHLIIIV